MGPINILIVDDEFLFSQGITSLLGNHNINTIATASEGNSALRLLKNIKPDVILLDLEMPVLNGSKTLDNIGIRYPKNKVIIVSSYHDEQIVKDHFNRGAKAYVSKREKLETLVSAIRTVHAGNIFNDNIPSLIEAKVVRDHHYYKLIFSSREQEIIVLLCEGLTRKEMANRLYLSEKTIETHLTEIYKKVKVKNRHEFLILAINEGLQFLGKPWLKKSDKSKNSGKPLN